MRAAALVLAIVVAVAAIPRAASALANPASVFCAESGGKSEILQTANGAQLGICILPGGEIVEEWAYFRACHPQLPESPPLESPSRGG